MINFENAYKDLSITDKDLYVQGKNKFIQEIQYAKTIHGKMRRLIDKKYIRWMEGENEPPANEEIFDQHIEPSKTYFV